MAIFDLEKEDKGVWFDMEGGGRVKLKFISPSDWMLIRKATIKAGEPVVKKVDDGSYKLFERETTDEDLQREMLHDMTIVDWEDILDVKERPIPCTKENKVRLMMMANPAFRNFVNDKLTILEKLSRDQEEAEEKN